MKLQKTAHFQAMMKKSFFWRFLCQNETKRNPSHAAEMHSSNDDDNDDDDHYDNDDDDDNNAG